MLRRFLSTNPSNLKTGAEVIYQKLIQHKIKDVFLYSGGSIMPLIDQFYKNKINYYVNTHEQNCGHAATGYAKSSNKMGVVITTSGPGITNLVTPMLDAQTDGVPLLVLSGQVGTDFMGTGAFQEAPACDITRPVTKMSYCIKEVSQIPHLIDYAIGLANDGRPGVVHLDLPKNVLLKEFNYRENKPTFESIGKSEINKRELVKIADAINGASKPIFFLGKGCSPNILKLVNKTGIPFTTSIHGKGIISEDHDGSLAWCGMHGSAASNYALQKADCIIGIGARFDDRTTGNLECYAPCSKNIVNINIDPNSFGKTINSNLNLCMKSEDFIDNIYHLLDNNIPDKNWLDYLDELKIDYPFKYRIPDNCKLNTPMVISKLNDLTLGRDTIFTTGVGNHQMMAYQFIKGDYPGKIHSSGSLGVMGAGLPYAIGCQIANPEKLVIDIDGDSSFLMTMSDMKTAVENNLPIKIAIMNDSRQMMVNIWERLFFEERYTATLNRRNPSFKEMAESFGFVGYRCSSSEDLGEVSEMFLSTEGPALCEYIVEPEICLPLVGPGKGLDEMIMFDEYHKNFGDIEIDKNFIPS